MTLKVKTINFHHYYDKLFHDTFTTIRNPNYSVKKGDYVEITVGDRIICHGIVYKQIISRIDQLSNTFLKEDCMYPNLHYVSRETFHHILDSFNRFSNVHPSKEEHKKSIIYIKKCDLPNQMKIEDYYDKNRI